MAQGNPKPSKSWVKGQSGNPKGRPPVQESLSELMREFLQQAPPNQKKTYKQLFIDKTYHKAVVEGDAASIKLIWQYLDGMPKQSIDHTSMGEKISLSALFGNKPE